MRVGVKEEKGRIGEGIGHNSKWYFIGPGVDDSGIG